MNHSWRCAYCHVTKQSKLKPTSDGCNGRKDPKTGRKGLHRWEKIR